MLSAVFAACCWLIFRHMTRGDPRRLRIAVWLVAAVFFSALVALEVAAYVGVNVALLVGIAVLLLPASVLFLAGLLLRNGLQMVRKEGRSLGNSLSGLLGLLLLVLPGLGAALLFLWGDGGLLVSLVLLYASAELGLSFLVFWVYAAWYSRRAPRPAPAAVVMLGAGLIRGGIGPLLRGRLNLGLEWFNRLEDRSAGRPCVLIPSGGQGPDEPRPEGDAMADYLVDHGAPPSAVVPETHSTTTEENLRFSRTMANEANTTGGHLLVATNDYHAPRTALLSRRIGIDADVVGSKTARYYAPSAFFREFVAMVKMHAWTHVVLALPCLAGVGLLAAGLVANG